MKEAAVSEDEVRILASELDPHFKYEVAEEPGGENIKVCFSCGVCTAGCPVSEIDPGYNPRKIVRMVLLGMREQVLASDFIWLCTLCYTCYARCPQNVRFTDVMGALRNMAVREGHVHPSFLKAVDGIAEFTQRLRHDMLVKALAKRKKKTEFRISDYKKVVNESLAGRA